MREWAGRGEDKSGDTAGTRSEPRSMCDATVAGRRVKRGCYAHVLHQRHGVTGRDAARPEKRTWSASAGHNGAIPAALVGMPCLQRWTHGPLLGSARRRQARCAPRRAAPRHLSVSRRKRLGKRRGERPPPLRGNFWDDCWLRAEGFRAQEGTFPPPATQKLPPPPAPAHRARHALRLPLGVSLVVGGERHLAAFLEPPV
mmetsp:Transcript_5172/g.11846  ORF Transcript_5172/g.11846 Transcript_5172/m.11846 type:complete len:200 (+) Transcript_5172:430-1029(+)